MLFTLLKQNKNKIIFTSILRLCVFKYAMSEKNYFMGIMAKCHFIQAVKSLCTLPRSYFSPVLGGVQFLGIVGLDLDIPCLYEREHMLA